MRGLISLQRNITTFAIWLGFGFAVQFFCYADLPIGALAAPTTSISVYAHILLWPLFLIWFLVKTFFFWLILAVVVVIAGIWLVSLWQNFAWKRHLRQNARRRQNARS